MVTRIFRGHDDHAVDEDVVAGAFFLIRHIRLPLQRSLQCAHEIASGDLSQALRATRQDEFGTLLRALEAMREQLARVVRQVRDGAMRVHGAAAEIAAGNQDLSGRTERTAARLQQTAARMQQTTHEWQALSEAAQQRWQHSAQPPRLRRAVSKPGRRCSRSRRRRTPASASPTSRA